MMSENRQEYFVTACLRILGRPLRTHRMLECISSQTRNGVEVLLMGDGCPHFAEMIRTGFFKTWKQNYEARGNRVTCINQFAPGDDWGASVTNIGIAIATGRFFLFLDNDDVIQANHFQDYYQSIARFDGDGRGNIDFVYNRTFVLNGGTGAEWVMDPKLEHGMVGHGSLIVRTAFLKKMPPHEKMYGQDWKLITDMLAAGAKAEKGVTLGEPTYRVMSIPGKSEPGFENDK